MRTRLLTSLILLTGLVLTSCEKEDVPVELPPKGSSEVGRVNMGEDYTDQIFYDLEHNTIVAVNEVSSWDLAFETGALGRHVFINGGKDMFVYNTQTTDFNAVTSLPKIKDTDWKVDMPEGSPDSTAIGEWTTTSGLSHGNVYIIKMNPAFFADTFKKIVLRAVDGNNYIMTYSDLDGGDAHTITIPKDDNYNYAYFTFSNGGSVVYPEPPKDSWDILFTRYRHVYRELDYFPYIVNGVLLNPYNTKAAEDSTTGYQNLNAGSIATAKMSADRDKIGFDWKIYDFGSGRYKVRPNMSFLIKTRKEQYYKLHFLDFYDENDMKGSPSFEFERLN